MKKFGIEGSSKANKVFASVVKSIQVLLLFKFFNNGKLHDEDRLIPWDVRVFAHEFTSYWIATSLIAPRVKRRRIRTVYEAFVNQRIPINYAISHRTRPPRYIFNRVTAKFNPTRVSVAVGIRLDYL